MNQQRISRALFGLLLAYAVLSGCKDSSGMTLTILGISPVAAPEGSTVTFSATLDGGTPPYTYSWDFTDVGTTSDPTAANPVVVIDGDPGEQSIGLTVSDRSDTVIDSFDFEITTDGITTVTPAEAGLPLGQATFEATSSGTPDSLAWDFGAGAEPSTSSDSAPLVTLQNPGTYAGTVTAVYDGVHAPAFPFNYTVAEPVRPAWTIMRLGDASTDFNWINMIAHEDRLTVIYANQGNLMCSRAKVEHPTMDADWDTHLIGPGVFAGHHCITSIRGRLAILYLTDTTPTGSRLRFALSTTEVPTSAADWTTYELGEDYFVRAEFGFTLAHIDDERLILAMPSFSDESGMRIAISDSHEPTEPGHWSVSYLIDKPNTGGFFWPNFAVRDDEIILTVQEGTGPISGSATTALRTESRNPEVEADWDLFGIISNSHFGSQSGAHDLSFLNDRAWVILGSGRGPRELRFFFSTGEGPTGSDWTDMSPNALLTSPAVPVGIPTIVGRAAVALPNFDDQTLRVARCALVDPTSESSWIETSVLNYGTQGGASGICSALAWHDRIAIAVLTDTGARVAIAQGPF